MVRIRRKKFMVIRTREQQEYRKMELVLEMNFIRECEEDWLKVEKNAIKVRYQENTRMMWKLFVEIVVERKQNTKRTLQENNLGEEILYGRVVNPAVLEDLERRARQWEKEEMSGKERKGEKMPRVKMKQEQTRMSESYILNN